MPLLYSQKWPTGTQKLKIQKHSDNELFVHLVLCEDRNFIVIVFGELLCCITLNEGLFLDLRLFVNRWLIIDCR